MNTDKSMTYSERVDDQRKKLMIHAFMYKVWAGAMPVAVTYANSGLIAAVATACSLALTRNVS